MKAYIKPSLKVQNVVFESPMMDASKPTLGGDANGNDGLTKGRRGTWGNLWYDGDDEGNR